MTENMKRFLEEVSKSEELSARVNAAAKEGIIAIARDMGLL